MEPAPSGRYTDAVHFVQAAVMAATLAVVTTIDRVACVDGCTDQAPRQEPSTPSPTTSPSVCGLCHGWNGPSIIDTGAPAPRLVATTAAVVSNETPAHDPPPDHPPKLA